MAVNTQGTANLAQAARAAEVDHLVYTSSITVYSLVANAGEGTPLVPTPGYPTSKIEAEKALRRLLPEQTTVLRLPLVLGAGDTGFLCPAMEGFRQAGRVIVIGSGQEPWSVLAAADAARAISLCLGRPEGRPTMCSARRSPTACCCRPSAQALAARRKPACRTPSPGSLLP